MKRKVLAITVLCIFALAGNSIADEKTDAVLSKAVEYQQAGEHEKAISEAEKIFTMTEDKKVLADAHWYIGYSSFETGKYNAALESYMKSAEYYSDDVELIENIIHCYYSLKDYEKLESYGLSKIKEFPDNLKIHAKVYEYFLGLKINNAKYLKEAVGLEPRLPEGDGRLCYNIACIYSLNGDAEKAVIYIDRSIYFCYSDIDKLKQRIEWMQKDADLDTIRGTEYYKIITTNSPDIIEGVKLFYQAKELSEKNRYDESINCYYLAVDKFKNASYNQSLWAAASCNNLGWVHITKGNYEQAESFHKEALKISIKFLGENHPEIAGIYNNIGAVYCGKGDFEGALVYYNNALKIRLSIFGRNHSYTSGIYNNIGFVYYNKGDYDRAVEFYEKALAIDLRIFGEKHLDVARCYSNIGAAYSYKGDYEQGIEYHDKALRIRLEILGEKHIQTATSYNNFGMIYLHKGDYDRAIDYFEKALRIRLEILGEYHVDTAKIYNNIGGSYQYKGDYNKAAEYYENALKINLKVLGEKHISTSTNYNNIGNLFGNAGDYRNAILYHEKSLEILKELGADQLTVTGSQNLGINYIDFGKYKQSYTSFLTGIETIEKARRLNLSGGTDFTSRNISSFYYAVNASYLDKNMNNMFNISERMRAMGYLERLSLKEAIDGAGIDPEQGKKLFKLKDDIERLSSFRQKLISMEVYKLNEQQKKERDRNLDNTSKQLEQAETEFSKLDAEFMKNDKYKMLRDTTVVSVEEAQKLCGADGAIIEYIIPEKSDEYMKPYALVITAKGVQAVELDSKYNATEQIEKYRTAIKEGKENSINSIGTELYTRLVAPVKGIINSPEIKKLMIVPDGSLAFLPFDSLKSNEDEYLSERYELSLTPSVTVSVMTRKREYKNSDRLLAFGGGIYSSTGESKPRGDRSFRGMTIEEKEKEKIAAKAYSTPSEYYNAQQLKWSDLPGTEREVTAINEKIYKKENTGLYTGEKVSEANIKSMSKQGKLKDYSKIHLACHGYYDPEYPAYSAVVFSEVSGKLKESKDDGYMSVEETALLNLRSDIVVLSACETGMGKLVRGDGVIGLTRAFQVAGSNRVLVTLWPVNDNATEAFMVSMYANVKDGMSYREAMVKVKEEFRRSKGSSRAADYSAPYFWAGFVLYE